MGSRRAASTPKIMPDLPDHNYVSAVYVHLIKPIAELQERMVVHCDAKKSTEVQAAPFENGYALSIIALTAILVEGACNRARYIGQIDGRLSASCTVRAFGNFDLADRLAEVFVVRDVIAHGHLWEGSVSVDLDWIDGPVLLPGYGDGKFNCLVDLKTRTTRRLKLNVFPPRIDRGTATTVIKECANALYYLQSKDRNYVYLDPIQVPVGGKLKPFYRWARELPH
jgi:hypothetical protein